MRQVFLMPINPEPWRTPPFSPGRHKNGHLYVKAGMDEQGAAFKDAVREELVLQNAELDDPPYKITFWFWRNLAKNKNEIDATNMQKLCEDAMQGLVLTNDRYTRQIISNNMEQGSNTPGMILIEVRGSYKSNSPIPDDLISSVDKMYAEQALRVNGTTFEEFKLDNTWP